MSCGPSPCHKIRAQGREDCLVTFMAILHKIRVLLTRLSPSNFPIIKQVVFQQVIFQEHVPILSPLWVPKHWLKGKACPSLCWIVTCPPYIIPMAVYAQLKTIWGTCYYASLAVNLKHKFSSFLDITSILAITYDTWLILPSPNSLSDIYKQEMKCLWSKRPPFLVSCLWETRK